MTRQEWLQIPISERAKIIADRSYVAYDKYHACVRRLYRKYYRDGGVIISIGNKPAPYRILEDMAWVKYVVNGK